MKRDTTNLNTIMKKRLRKKCQSRCSTRTLTLTGGKQPLKMFAHAEVNSNGLGRMEILEYVYLCPRNGSACFGWPGFFLLQNDATFG